MAKKIMILGASILQLPAIEKAKEMGLEVIAVDMDPYAVGFAVDGVTKEVISTIDTAGVLEAAKRHKIDGIMTLASDMPMQTVAAVCHELSLTGVTKECALKTTNKAVMREALDEAGVSIPAYFRVSDMEQFLEAVREIQTRGYRCITKPADNSGSRGVCLIDGNRNHDKEELKEVYGYCKSFSRGGELVVEEYMEGPEVSVETLASGGEVHVIQITDKMTTGTPFFVEMGHDQPSRHDIRVQQQIKDVAIAANKALGITDGPSHTEIIVTKDGPKIVELGARLGGDCITTHLVPLSTGLNMVENSIRIALGERPDLEKKWDRGSAIRYFKTEKGIIDRIEGLEEAKKCPGIVEIRIVHGPGESVGRIKSSNDRAGFVIASAKSREQAVRDAEEAASRIHFVINNSY